MINMVPAAAEAHHPVIAKYSLHTCISTAFLSRDTARLPLPARGLIRRDGCFSSISSADLLQLTESRLRILVNPRRPLP
ncbi:hypothetical protein GB937_006029 [Aspergillus fischeri]|nr:hypothetical protein GB937_006029 [Aspergillus fischeri]